MSLSAIVAVSQNGVIGRGGQLPWRLPDDLANFKKITMGHPVIMGRKTHESIGRPLPGRQNIVISRDKKYIAEGCTVVNSLDDAVEETKGSAEAFIIGGSSIYKLAIPKVDTIYRTLVKADVVGDSFFEIDMNQFKKISSKSHPVDGKNEYQFDFQQWVRK